MSALAIAPADPAALAVALAAFRGLQRGAATGDWSGFTDLMAEEVRIMIPVPPGLPDPLEGVIAGRDDVRRRYDAHHAAQVADVRLEGMRVAASGSVVAIEARVEGSLGGEVAANQYMFVFEIAGGEVRSMHHYVVWTAKGPQSRWSDPGFAREAFGEAIL